MAFDATQAERIRQQLARRKRIEEKTLFGCVGVVSQRGIASPAGQ